MLSIVMLRVTIFYCYVECRYTECRYLNDVMLSVVMLSVAASLNASNNILILTKVPKIKALNFLFIDSFVFTKQHLGPIL
jgi:hypothetical protein